MLPITEAVQEIDDCHWLISETLLLTHVNSAEPPTGVSWKDGEGGFFALSEAPRPLPSFKPLYQGSRIRKVHEGGTVAAVWQVGDAFLKVKKVSLPQATREHTTLEYLHRRELVEFDIPTVYFHRELEDQYFIILSKLPGQTIAGLWPTMDETTKNLCANRIAAICESLTAWKGDTVSGVDGHQLSDLFLTKRKSNDCRNQSLLKNCQEQGMDCSSFVFYHCDLGPGNILISSEGSIGIIDWETAGFVPREWIRTKFRISSGMDLPSTDQKTRTDWRRRVSQRLEFLGFQDVAGGWESWWRS